MIWTSDWKEVHNGYSRVRHTWLLFLTSLPMPWPTADSFQGVWLWSCLHLTYHTFVWWTLPLKPRECVTWNKTDASSNWTSPWMCCQTSLGSFSTLGGLERHSGARSTRDRQASLQPSEQWRGRARSHLLAFSASLPRHSLWSSLPFRGLCSSPCLPSPVSQQGLFCAEGPVTHVRKHSLTWAPPPLPIAASMSWVSSPPAKFLCEEISVLQADTRLSVKSSQDVLSGVR